MFTFLFFEMLGFKLKNENKKKKKKKWRYGLFAISPVLKCKLEFFNVLA